MESSQKTAGTPASGNGNDGSPVVEPITISMDDPKQNLNQINNSIQETLGILHQLYITVSSFNVSSQDNLVLELDNMSKLADKCDIQVPPEVLNFVDDGKNPDEFARDVLNSALPRIRLPKAKPTPSRFDFSLKPD
ncbi:hypothetical protein ACH5RR_041824 [Cinchona calisaya]|uniref:Mediator of RNA polymerase II transcription subunit 10 n=1 Tax=Cinchona calisaya TaxID=153742 RepID=A0ABD2XUL7_9GENT